MSELGQEKVVQYLFEAHALELMLVHTLTAHIAITPAGSYRDALTDHLKETRDHAVRIQKHLAKREITRSLLEAGYGIAQGMVGQAVAFSKLPIDLLRGFSFSEKLVKNAKDEITIEAQEIATYLALEHLAREVGDTATARLAASIREDEERMMARLQRELRSLVADVVKAEVELDPQYDVRRIGAVDAVRSAAGTAARTLTGSTKSKSKSASKPRAAASKARTTGTSSRTTKATAKPVKRSAAKA
ncbi:MAG: hypothetical protein JWM98_108 [Thermoleophilia bacterium]|nr:hypothetical protein [Thermoleophilia bacterium]